MNLRILFIICNTLLLILLALPAFNSLISSDEEIEAGKRLSPRIRRLWNLLRLFLFLPMAGRIFGWW